VLLEKSEVSISLAWYFNQDSSELILNSRSMNLGRAPVTAVFDEALELLMVNRKKFSGFVTHRLPLAEAAEGYRLFEKQEARKVVLKL